jgi:hypothetical protein
MSNLTDRAGDFWERISPRERMLVVLGAIAVPLTLALWLGLEIHDGLSAMETRNERSRHALKVLDDLRSRGSAPAPVTPSDDLVKNMPVEPLSLDTYLNKAAQKAGFPLKGTRPHAQTTRNGFITASVSCDLEALTIDELKTFLQAVESDSKYVAVTKLDVKRSRSKPDKVEVSLDVATYASEKKAAPDGAGSGSSSGETGSAGSAGSAKGG